jgi:quercetin dioxygenase-like cupin family protein
MITVLDIPAMAATGEGNAEVTRFLNAQTAGARRVEGMAYRLRPGGSLRPLREAAAYQLFYVTAGQPMALYGGQRHELAPGRGVYCEPGEPCAFENPAGAAPAAFYRFIVPA